MKKIVVKPLLKVDDAEFGADRKKARQVFGKKYKEIKKNIFAKSTMDAYDEYNVYYSKEGIFEAIEFFGELCVYINEKKVFPGKIKALKTILPHLELEEDGYIDRKNSVGVTVCADSPEEIESILFGCKDYYA